MARRTRRKDRMSRLPDEILLHILSFLPTNNAVSTSILSFRYGNLWTELPVIDLEDEVDPKFDTFTFVNFVDKLLRDSTSPTIHKFRLKLNHYFDASYLSHINGWIRFVLSRNVVELDLEIRANTDDNYDDGQWRLRLLPCASLRILKLNILCGVVIPVSGACFPNLRIFHFTFVQNHLYRKLGAKLSKLVPNLPLLEELVIQASFLHEDEPEEIRFNIVAPALKTFAMYIEDATNADELDVEVVIEAPLLEHICFAGDGPSFYSLKNSPFISEAELNFGDALYWFVDACNPDSSTYTSDTMKLLSGVADTKSLSLCGRSMLALACSRSSLPAFPHLTKLDLFIPYAPVCKLLLPLLVNAPNLKVLSVVMREHRWWKKKKKFFLAEEIILLAWAKGKDVASFYAEQESSLAGWIGDLRFYPPDVVPTCLLLHLQEIEVRGFKMEQELKILAYIVENAKVLKKLTVDGVRKLQNGVNLL